MDRKIEIVFDKSAEPNLDRLVKFLAEQFLEKQKEPSAVTDDKQKSTK